MLCGRLGSLKDSTNLFYKKKIGETAGVMSTARMTMTNDSRAMNKDLRENLQKRKYTKVAFQQSKGEKNTKALDLLKKSEL